MSTARKEEERVMRPTDTILDVISERGRRRLPLERVYRLLFNRDLYLRAYAKISSNQGAMTPGVTSETVDGMSIEKIDAIIERVRQERYRWSPARRVYIEKKNSTKKRPLGMPTWSDKLLQEVLRMILSAYYEPQFSDHSHGFRPQRGCHRALAEIEHAWTGTIWFIEGDISGYFDNIDHEILLSILATHIHDNRFLRLIKDMLKAGYLEDWTYNATLSGTPQGGIVSPVLANIYLDQLDKYVENTLYPAYNRKAIRRVNPAYRLLQDQRRQRRRDGKDQEASQLLQEMRKLPSGDMRDPEFRRLKYVRYADDFLIGFAGPRAEAEQIKAKLQEFLGTTLKLELSENKTLITHAATGAAKFLGYEIHIARNDTCVEKTGRRRSVNGSIRLKVPVAVIKEKCRFYMRGEQPIHRPEKLNNDAFSIVAQYQAEYRGLAEYYALAHDRSQRFTRLSWVMHASLVRTLAAKFKVSSTAIIRRYATTHTVDDRTYKVLEVRVPREGHPPLVARWGGISLTRKKKAYLNDLPPIVWNKGTELLQRVLAATCELCESQENI